MKIYNDKHYDAECIVMEKSNIRLKILPQIGFKISSLTYKDKELLFQPVDLKYKQPVYMDSFSSYDTSGMDEMLPTIDSCIDEYGQLLPDHGDVWSLPWYIEISDDSSFITGRVILRSMPLAFEKKIAMIEDNLIRMDYTVKNLSMKEQYFLWALHGLNNYDDDTYIILPDGVKRVLDVINNEIIEDNLDNLKDLSKYEDGKAYKFYAADELSSGICGLYYKNLGLEYLIKFDKNIIPYLGVWITKGGFKGEYNCALEPSNGFYDSQAAARERGKCEKVMPLEEKSWTVYIEIRETRRNSL